MQGRVVERAHCINTCHMNAHNPKIATKNQLEHYRTRSAERLESQQSATLFPVRCVPAPLTRS